MKMEPDTSEPLRDRKSFVSAVKFGGVVVGLALVVLIASLAWVSGCKTGTGQGALDACTGVQRNMVALGAPVILLLGGFGAFVATYRVWRARGGWWIWQGAGWFLLVLMLVVLAMTVPSALL